MQVHHATYVLHWWMVFSVLGEWLPTRVFALRRQRASLHTEHKSGPAFGTVIARRRAVQRAPTYKHVVARSIAQALPRLGKFPHYQCEGTMWACHNTGSVVT